jgi:Dolichyl-phosphate-mannose-protein mannosyltransferase
MQRPVAIAVTAVLIALAFGLRLGYLNLVRAEPGFGFSDPDHYVANGARLASPERGWQWTFEAVHYRWGRSYTLPPLYPAFLSAFARFPGYPLSAAIGQIVLNSLTVGLVVLLGARLHSVGAGLVGGFLYAIWGSAVVGTRFFMQESLYVPLVVVAFLALARAFDGSGSPRRFFLAGVALGLAALCRSMPVYFLAAVVVVHVALAGDRRAALRQAAALVAGFALLTVPYSLALSIHLGHPTFIEDHGGVLKAVPGESRAPGLVTVALALVSEFVAGPTAFVGTVLDNARSLFHVAGGRFLEQTVHAPSKDVADAWKAFAHATIDAPLLVTVLLAPMGAALARNRPLAALSVGWALLNVALTALMGFGGARLRTPFEPHMMVLAGVVLAGGHRRPSRIELAAAAIGTALIAWATLVQIPRTLSAHGNYGVEWTAPAPPHVATVRGDGGFNALLEPGGLLSLGLHNPGDTPLSARMWVKGAHVIDLQIAPGQVQKVRVVQRGRLLAFVEIQARSPSGAPGAVVVDVPRR